MARWNDCTGKAKYRREGSCLRNFNKPFGTTGCTATGRRFSTLRSAPAFPSVVIFTNKDLGIHMTALVGEDGQYTVKMASGEGLPLGTYQVAVTPGPGKSPAFKPGPPIRVDSSKYPKIPKTYQDPKTSGLTLTVKEGDNPFNIEMK
jgi:hypothetical protein